MVTRFKLLRTCQKIFRRGCTISHVRILILPHPCQHLFLSVFCAQPAGCQAVLILLSICISLMADEVGHLLTCLLAICTTSWQKCPLYPWPSFNWVVFFLLSCSLYTGYKILIRYMFPKRSLLLWAAFSLS